MCKVYLDLAKGKNLDFAIYVAVLAKTERFTEDEIVKEFEKYSELDLEKIRDRVKFLLKKWMDYGIIQEHWDTYSVLCN